MEKKDRLISLDAFRGADMLFIMGFAALVERFCSWLGMKGCWLAQQMHHVEWHGWHLMDGVFPVFMFISGLSWPFSLAKQRERGVTDGRLWMKIGKRVLVLFLLLWLQSF